MGGLDGLLASPEGVYLGLQALAGHGEAPFLGLHVGILALQVGQLFPGGAPACPGLLGQVAPACLHRRAALLAKLADLLFQLISLQFQPLARRGHVSDSPAYAGQHLKLPLIGGIQVRARVQGWIIIKRDHERRPRALPADPQSGYCLIDTISGGGIAVPDRGQPLLDLGSHPDQVAHARLHDVGRNTYYRILAGPATICAPAFAGTGPGDLGAEPGMYRTRTINVGIGPITSTGLADQPILCVVT
jgi:hypothetical protein